ncbi:hypothetical protein JCM9279_004122 [Rhodotorula babjevae]
MPAADSDTPTALATPTLDHDSPSPVHLVLPDADWPKPASWNRLPVELKQQIVDAVLHEISSTLAYMTHHLESTLAVSVGFFQRRKEVRNLVRLVQSISSLAKG